MISRVRWRAGTVILAGTKGQARASGYRSDRPLRYQAQSRSKALQRHTSVKSRSLYRLAPKLLPELRN